MAILHVRGIPEPLYKRAQRIAESRGKSLSQLVIESLERLDAEEAARRKHVKVMAEIRANMAKRKPLPNGMTAAAIIREVRKEREAELLPGL
jgi:fructose-1,6-bisphosphatase/sedoheptulose 1,7-bisphosphatase-like protein